MGVLRGVAIYSCKTSMHGETDFLRKTLDVTADSWVDLKAQANALRSTISGCHDVRLKEIDLNATLEFKQEYSIPNISKVITGLWSSYYDAMSKCHTTACFR